MIYGMLGCMLEQEIMVVCPQFSVQDCVCMLGYELKWYGMIGLVCACASKTMQP